MAKPNSVFKKLARNLAPPKIDNRRFRLKKSPRFTAEQAIQLAHAMNEIKKATGVMPSFVEFIEQVVKCAFPKPPQGSEANEAEEVLQDFFAQEGGGEVGVVLS